MAPEIHKILGDYLKNKRQTAGFTQSEVARKLGYSTPQFISNFERGLCSPPLKVIKTLVRMYEIPVEEVVEIIISEQESYLRSVLTSKTKKSKKTASA